MSDSTKRIRLFRALQYCYDDYGMQQTPGKRARSDFSVLKLIPLWAFSLRPLAHVISSDSGISSNTELTENSWQITVMDFEILDVESLSIA